MGHLGERKPPGGRALHEDETVRITLNRPEVLNALSFDLKREMETALDEAVADEDVRAVVLTRAGRRSPRVTTSR